jgi:hypothetical protein
VARLGRPKLINFDQDRKKSSQATVVQIELAQYPNTVSTPATNMKSRIAILLSSLSDDEIEDGGTSPAGVPAFVQQPRSYS